MRIAPRTEDPSGIAGEDPPALPSLRMKRTPLDSQMAAEGRSIVLRRKKLRDQFLPNMLMMSMRDGEPPEAWL